MAMAKILDLQLSFSLTASSNQQKSQDTEHLSPAASLRKASTLNHIVQHVPSIAILHCCSQATLGQEYLRRIITAQVSNEKGDALLEQMPNLSLSLTVEVAAFIRLKDIK